jgi:hypothetical protein
MACAQSGVPSLAGGARRASTDDRQARAAWCSARMASQRNRTPCLHSKLHLKIRNLHQRIGTYFIIPLKACRISIRLPILRPSIPSDSIDCRPRFGSVGYRFAYSPVSFARFVHDTRALVRHAPHREATLSPRLPPAPPCSHRTAALLGEHAIVFRDDVHTSLASAYRGMQQRSRSGNDAFSIDTLWGLSDSTARGSRPSHCTAFIRFLVCMHTVTPGVSTRAVRATPADPLTREVSLHRAKFDRQFFPSL